MTRHEVRQVEIAIHASRGTTVRQASATFDVPEDTSRAHAEAMANALAATMAQLWPYHHVVASANVVDVTRDLVSYGDVPLRDK